MREKAPSRRSPLSGGPAEASKARRLKIVPADFDGFPRGDLPILQGCLSDAERCPGDYGHHAKKWMLTERSLFACFDGDFEHPDLFILEDHT
jgi:hypothetical protein